MSVLKSRRSLSRAEYVNTANQIYTETLAFLSRLSARYSRLLAVDTAHLASELSAYTEKANSIMPSDELRFNQRRSYLLSARAALVALDVNLSHVYEILMQNPEGAFSTPKGSSVPRKEAADRLDRMADSLGEKLDRENVMINGVLKADKRTLSKAQKNNNGCALE